MTGFIQSLSSGRLGLPGISTNLDQSRPKKRKNRIGPGRLCPPMSAYVRLCPAKNVKTASLRIRVHSCRPAGSGFVVRVSSDLFRPIPSNTDQFRPKNVKPTSRVEFPSFQFRVPRVTGLGSMVHKRYVWRNSAFLAPF